MGPGPTLLTTRYHHVLSVVRWIRSLVRSLSPSSVLYVVHPDSLCRHVVNCVLQGCICLRSLVSCDVIEPLQLSLLDRCYGVVVLSGVLDNHLSLSNVGDVGRTVYVD